MVSHSLNDTGQYHGPIDETRSIPPEVYLRDERSLRFQRNGVIYASDGRVGTLKQIVVTADHGEVAEVIVRVEATGHTVVLPVALVDKTGGSAIFLGISRAQFTERASGAPEYAKRRFKKVGLRPLRKKGKRAEEQRRFHAVAQAGPDFVETPIVSRLGQAGRQPGRQR
jgi:hypothetical protein